MERETNYKYQLDDKEIEIEESHLMLQMIAVISLISELMKIKWIKGKRD